MHHLVGAAEIAEMIGLSRQRVHQLRTEDPAFPEPIVILATGPIWERAAVEQWAQAAGRLVLGEE